MNRIIKAFYMVAIGVALVVALGMFAEFKSMEKIVLSEMETVNRLQRDTVTAQINTRLQVKGKVIENAAAFIEGEQDEQRILKYLKALMETNPAFASIYFGTPDNVMINGSGWIPPETFDLRTRPWYMKAMKENRRVFTEAFVNATRDRLIVTVAMPVYSGQGQLRGVVAGDIGLENILEIVNTTRKYANGYTLLIDNQGSLLAHPRYGTEPFTGEPMNLKALSEELAETVGKGGTGTVRLRLEGVDGFFAYEPVPDTDWIVGSFVPMDDYIDHGDQMQRFFLVTAAAVVVVAFIMLQLQKRYILLPVLALDRDILKISAEQDLTYRLPVDGNDPFLRLRESVNAVLERTQHFFMQSEAQKDELAAANDELAASLQQLAAAEGVLREQHEALLESQQALRNSEERNRAIVNALPDLLFRLDDQGVFLDCQVGDESQLLMNKSDFLGKSMQQIMPEPIATQGFETITRTLQTHRLQTYEYSLTIADSERYYEMRTAESNPKEVVAIIRDITDQKRSLKHIEYLSYHDQLTGLYNRRFFEEELRRLDTERNLPFTLVMLDVNGLKLTNDAFGHQVGDELLRRVAGILKAESRADDIIARIGGDEFVILLPKTTFEEAEWIVKRILHGTSLQQVEKVVISVSAGWATKTVTEQTMMEVFIRAEEHMYRKKLVESQSMRNATIQVILRTLKETNERERVHSDKVSALCARMGEALHLDSDAVKELGAAGLMHDIGKIAISENLLNKPGKLTVEEYEEVCKHPEVGYQILKSVDAFSPLAESILSHHERWDGMGYPRGLKGTAIPLYARIITVADAYEAMTSDRPYRQGMSKAEALKELRRCAGTQFDPELVELLAAMES